MSPCLINTFLTLPLDGRASGFMFGYFNPTEKVLPGTHWTRCWVAPRVGPDVLNRKTFSLLVEVKPDPSVTHPTT